jgi:broad specificity phosphatase PhoE
VTANPITETAGHQPQAMTSAGTTCPNPAAKQGDACRVYLIRHGTTTLNGENRYRGRRDIPLDAQGYEDAVRAARLLCDVGLTAVYTGPLRRTITTGQIIADAAEIPDLRILPWLTNLDYGLWEGMTAAEAATHDPEAYDLYRVSPLRAACPQGERLGDARLRVVKALRLIGSRHPGESVAAVTHAVMLRLALLEAGSTDNHSWRAVTGQRPMTQFRITTGTIRLAECPEC